MDTKPHIYIGCHLPVTRGDEVMGETMLQFGGNRFLDTTGGI